MAEHSNTNPVVVRRVLGLLRTAGLRVSEKGHHGGWMLARRPEDISLADVYLPLGERFLHPDPDGDDNPAECLVERALRAEVEKALDASEAVLVEHLSKSTIAQIGLGEPSTAKVPT